MNTPIQDLDEDALRSLLHDICDRFGIGLAARNGSTILTNLGNVLRRSDCLTEVESHHTYLEVETEDDDEGVEVCPLHWGDSPEQYRARYEALMAADSLSSSKAKS